MSGRPKPNIGINTAGISYSNASGQIPVTGVATGYSTSSSPLAPGPVVGTTFSDPYISARPSYVPIVDGALEADFVPISSLDASESAAEAFSKKPNYVISSEYQKSSDTFRNAIQRYWIEDASDIKFNKQYIPSKIKIKSIDITTKPILNFEDGNVYDGIAETLQIGVDSDPLGDAADAASTSAQQQFLMSSRVFESLSSLQQSQEYSTIEVYAHNCDKPIEYPSEPYGTSLPKKPIVDISFVYNYEMPNYEQLISDPSISESELLNYYNDYQKIHDSLTQALLSSFSPSTGAKGGPTTSYTYARDSKENVDQELVSKTREKNKEDTNIIVSENDTESESKNESVDTPFALPFYIKIDIGKSTNPPPNDELDSSIKSIIMSEQSDCDKLMKYALDLTSPGSNPEYYKKRSFSYSHLNALYKNSDQTEFDLAKNISSESMFLIDALDMSQNVGDKSVVLNSNNPSVSLIGAQSLNDGAGDYWLSKKIEQLLDISKSQKLQNSYTEIISGNAKFFHTDIIFYKIAKFDESDLINPIQNIFIPNNKDTGHTYIDFQVKYGKKYIYKVYAYKFISGTQYSLSVSEPYDASYFSSEIEEYLKFRDIYNPFPKTYPKIRYKEGGEIFTSNEYFDQVLNFLVAQLQDFVDGKKESFAGKINISPQKDEGLDSLEKNSYLLRRAVHALNMFVVVTGDTPSTLLRKIGTQINNRLNPIGGTGTGGAIAADSVASMTEEEKEKWQSAYDAIESFRVKVRTLSSHLNSILKSEHGLSKHLTGNISEQEARAIRAQHFIDAIEEVFPEAENLLLEKLSLLKTSEYDEEFDVNAKNLTAFTYPVVQLAEIPYYMDSGAILDNPPMFPDVNFITYKGNSSKLSLFLNSGTGELLDVPITFSEDEEQFYSLFRQSREYNEVQPIPFKSDESQNMASSFEIYRTSMPPESYQDFSGALYQTLSESFKGGTQKLTSVSYMDEVHSNKTYYYMFRQKDSRGVVSNPSQVFSVILIDEGGLVFPIINKYDFPTPDPDYERPVKKLLNIAPSINQITPRTLPSGESYDSYSGKNDINDIMGVEEKGIFGKTFKIRFTSKKTGKQVDLNVTFTTEIT
jgi:hypothetical protein